MKVHTNDYKNNIKLLGREIDSKITYTLNGEEIELGSEELNSITPHYEGNILKSVMKQLDIDSNEDIAIGTEINYKFGVKVRNLYEYLDFGNYIVYSSEKQEDTKSYKIICYDKMLYSMKDYQDLEITYPISIRDYINEICIYLGLTFANVSDTFANYNREINSELYLDADKNSLGYTFRDVLDELAQVTASTICINDEDELEIRYINDTASNNLFNFKKWYNNKNGINVSSGNITLDENSIYFTNPTQSEQYVENTYHQNRTNPTEEEINIVKKYGNKIEPSETYYISYYQNNYSRVTLFFYDEDFKYLTFTGSSRSSQDRITYQFTTPSNAKYICYRFQNSSYSYASSSEEANMTMTKIQLNKGDLIDYEEYDINNINEEFLKDINVNFSEKYGPINSIVLSRSSDADNVYLKDNQSIAENGLCELKIKDNQIMNFNDRADYLPDILEVLDGFEYYVNDFSSTGITFYELCDRYNVNIDNNSYSCIMFNDEINITQGLEENIHTDMPEESETDYTKADKTDRKINQTYLIVDKQNQTITSLASNVGQYDERISVVEQDVDSLMQSVSIFEDLTRTSKSLRKIHITDSTPTQPLRLSIKNASLVYPSKDLYPSSNLYPKDSWLIIDKTEQLSNDAKMFHLPLTALYTYEDVYDEFVIENNQMYVIHRIGVNQDESLYILEEETIENLGNIEITLFDNENYIYLYSFQDEGVIYELSYLTHSAFTDTFATKVEVNSKIEQTVDSIMLEVNEKVDEEEIIAKLNVAVEEGQGVINLIGNTVTIESDNFQLDEDGKIEATAGKIGGFEIDEITFSSPLTTLIRMWNGEEFVDTEMEIFTNEDLTKVRNYISGTGTLTPAELARYDVNHDGVVDVSDLALMTVTTYYNINTNNPGRFLLNTTSATNVITLYDKDDNERVNLGMYNFEMQSADGNKKTQINFNGVSSPAFNNNSLETYKKNFKKLNNALDIINKSDIYSYNWKEENDDDKKHYGLVIGKKFNTPNEFLSNDGTGIDTYAMVSICLQAIKEQQEEIEKLKKEIKELKK